MRIETKVIIAIIFLITLIYAADKFFYKQKEYEYDFRNAKWGMSIDEVKATENKAPKREYDLGPYYTLTYQGTFDGMSTDYEFKFKDGKLWDVSYDFDIAHDDKNLYISDYEKVKKTLSDEYGKPDHSYYKWESDLYKDNPGQYGTAISLGQLTFYTYWKTNSTVITLVLAGSDSKIRMYIFYSPTKLDFLLKRK